jgi:hypothetical protein
MKTLRINYDYWWKKLTTELTPDFIQFFFPVLFNQVDWTHPPEYLEQELIAAFSTVEGRKKIADKLICLRLKNGKVKFIFVHIEFQGKSGKAFSKRMFWYYVYIMAKYHTTDITAIAIYTGDSVTNINNTFRVEQYGTIMSYIFNTYIVSIQNEADLLASNNPLAIAVLANLYVNQTHTAFEKRAEYKKKLLELALFKGYDRTKTERLLNFVFYLMQLPKDMEAEMKSFYKKNKTTSQMAAATQAQVKPKKERLTKVQREIRDLTYEYAYGMSYAELYDSVYDKATEKAKENTEVELAEGKAILATQQAILATQQAKLAAAEQANLVAEQAKLAAEQAKLAAEQANALSAEKIEQSIAMMFKKTGWTSEKIADITGFSIELVQKIVDKFKE